MVVDTAFNGSLERVLIDCGADVQRVKEVGGEGTTPGFGPLEGRPAKVCLSTHGHADHNGGLPEAVQSGALDGPIYATAATHSLGTLALEDLVGKRLVNIFSAVNLVDRQKLISKVGAIQVLPGLPIGADSSGHVRGAASYVVPFANGIRGQTMIDTCFHDQPTIGGARIPLERWTNKRDAPNAIIATDLTGGIKERPPIETQVERLRLDAQRAIERGKKMICPALGVGRGQNVALWLTPLLRDLGVPLYIDGMIDRGYEIFRNSRWCPQDTDLPPLGPESNIFPIPQGRDSNEVRHRLLANPNPLVVVTTGGMGDFGPIRFWLEQGLGRSGFVFRFTSHLGLGTNGYRLVEQSRKNVGRAGW